MHCPGALSKATKAPFCVEVRRKVKASLPGLHKVSFTWQSGRVLEDQTDLQSDLLCE